MRHGRAVVADLLRLGAVHPKVHIGFIEWLLDARVGYARYVFHLIQQGIREGLIPLQISPHHLNVDGSRQAKIKDLSDHIGRQERKGHAGKFFCQADSEVVNVLGCLMVVNAERHQDIRIRGTHGSSIQIGRVDAAVRQADIVDNVGDLARRKLSPNRSLDKITEASGLFDS